MAEKQKEEEEYSVPITQNVMNQNEVIGIPKRRWIEGIVFTFLFFMIISLIPFTSVVKNVILLVFGGGLFFLCIHGIKDRSITEIFISEIKFQKRKRILHLVGPEFKRQKGVAAGGQNSEMSDAERLSLYVKEKINDFTDKYAD